jgi:hypothetical protein
VFASADNWPRCASIPEASIPTNSGNQLREPRARTHDAEKGFVGIDDPTIGTPHDDPYEVRVEQPPYHRFPVLQIAIETNVFQRGRNLGSEQREQGCAYRCEKMCREIVSR